MINKNIFLSLLKKLWEKEGSMKNSEPTTIAEKLRIADIPPGSKKRNYV